MKRRLQFDDLGYHPRVKGFHMLVWANGFTRVFGDLKDSGSHTYGVNHWPQFDGKLSLWLLIRLWWHARRAA